MIKGESQKINKLCMMGNDQGPSTARKNHEPFKDQEVKFWKMNTGILDFNKLHRMVWSTVIRLQTDGANCTTAAWNKTVDWPYYA